MAPRRRSATYLQDRIQIDPATGCWHWIGTLTEKGYGLAGYYDPSIGRSRSIRAHRLVYQTLIGPIPDGYELDHLCRVRDCVNPYHVEPVTRRVNQLRGYGVSGIAARKQTCKEGHALIPLAERSTTGARRHCPLCKAARWAKRKIT